MMYKKTISFITTIALFCSCEKDPVQSTEIPVTKKIQFNIAKDSDYSLPFFDSLKAEVKLSVAKESLLNGSIIAVWDTTLSLRKIRDYAVRTNPLIITKQVNGLLQSKEAVRVSRVIRYVREIQIAQDALGESIPAGLSVKEVIIRL